MAVQRLRGSSEGRARRTRPALPTAEGSHGGERLLSPDWMKLGGKGQAVSGFHTRPRTPESLSPWGNCQGRVARCAPRPGRACWVSASVSQAGLASQGPPGDAASRSRSGFPASKLMAPSWVGPDRAPHVSLVVTEITEKAPGGGQEIWL